MPVLGAEGGGAGVSPVDAGAGFEDGEAGVAVIEPGSSGTDTLGDVFAAIEMTEGGACLGVAGERILDAGEVLVIATVDTGARACFLALFAGAAARLEGVAAGFAAGAAIGDVDHCDGGGERGN